MKKQLQVERIQTGMRIEKRILKTLKALAEYLDMSLGDLLEGIVLHAFDGKPSPFDQDLLQRVGAELLGLVQRLKRAPPPISPSSSPI